MSWEAEFTSQWQTFLDIVETLVRREIKKGGRMDSASINTIIESEVAKWSISNHYNGAWLRNLTRDHATLGDEFNAALKELRLKEPISFDPGFPIFHILAVVMFTIIAFFITKWRNMSIIKQIIVALAVAVMVTPFSTTLWGNRKKKVIDSLVEQMRKELETIRYKLQAITARADKSS